MKKLINTAFFYVFLALAFGVFYREFTKFNNFTGVTKLSFVHTHLLALGGIIFFIIALFAMNTDILKDKKFNAFYILYNIGVLISSSMFVVRGVFEVKSLILSKALNASISGIAGIGHTLIAIGFILLFIIFKRSIKEK